jgi:hypothetical protein
MQEEGANHRLPLRYLFEAHKKSGKQLESKIYTAQFRFTKTVSSKLTVESFQQIKCFQAQAITALLSIFWMLRVKCMAMKFHMVREWLIGSGTTWLAVLPSAPLQLN